jgi:hypothetical protein
VPIQKTLRAYMEQLSQTKPTIDDVLLEMSLLSYDNNECSATDLFTILKDLNDEVENDPSDPQIITVYNCRTLGIHMCVLNIYRVTKSAIVACVNDKGDMVKISNFTKYPGNLHLVKLDSLDEVLDLQEEDKYRGEKLMGFISTMQVEHENMLRYIENFM